jgi:hypothetical protein
MQGTAKRKQECEQFDWLLHSFLVGLIENNKISLLVSQK